MLLFSYRLLTGVLPFESDDTLDLIHAILAKPAIPVSIVNSSIPDVVSSIINKLLQKHSSARYNSAEGLSADLRRCQHAVKQQQKRRSRAKKRLLEKYRTTPSTSTIIPMTDRVSESPDEQSSEIDLDSTTYKIKSFELGANDVADKLQIKEKP